MSILEAIEYNVPIIAKTVPKNPNRISMLESLNIISIKKLIINSKSYSIIYLNHSIN